MRIKYSYQNNNTILMQYYEGDANIPQMIDFFAKLYVDDRYRSVLYIVSDMRQLNPTATEAEIMEMARYVAQYSVKDNVIRNAVLVQEPMQTAFSLLYKMATQDMLYDCEVSCTVAAAAAYIGIQPEVLKHCLHKTKYESFEIA